MVVSLSFAPALAPAPVPAPVLYKGPADIHVTAAEPAAAAQHGGASQAPVLQGDEAPFVLPGSHHIPHPIPHTAAHSSHTRPRPSPWTLCHIHPRPHNCACQNRSCYALVDQLLNSIPSVGGAGAGAGAGAATGGTGGAAGGAGGAVDARVRLPGEAPVAIQLELAATVHAADLAEQGGANVIPAATAAPAAAAWAGEGAGAGAAGEGEGSDHPPPAPKQYVAGTTWVFDDDRCVYAPPRGPPPHSHANCGPPGCSTTTGACRH